MEQGDTNWGKSVGVVVARGGKVLLGRHTYGPGTGLLIIPGGYLDHGESAEEAAAREVLEETCVEARVEGLCGMRFSERDWYAVFSASYVAGEARPGDEENSEVVWMDVDEALGRDDVPGLTKAAIRSALGGKTLAPQGYDRARERWQASYYG
jgi:ADP-ribose pyrophosphatase YjhB (NUDIX family)